MGIIAGIFGIATIIAVVVLTYAVIDDRKTAIKMQRSPALSVGYPIVAFLIGTAITASIAIGYPKYLIWQQEQEGAAELAKAEQNRQIAIQEAKAKEESAKSLANAEVIRAEGVAKANKIIGDSLQNNDAYIHYLWIEALKESKDQVIYVPTEAGIPVTESARFFKNKQETK